MRPLVAGLLVVLAVPVQAQSLAENLDAARVATQVEIALAQDADLRAFVFTPVFADGVMKVTGRVETAAQRDHVREVIEAVEGITSVVNSVVVGGPQTADVGDLPPAPEAPVGSSAEAEEAPPAPEPERVYHTVRRGDTLGAIARRYGVSVRQIQRLNGLSGTRIRAGQRLRVQ